MSTLVKLNIFSGRPDPRWFIDEKASAELRERIYRNPTLVSAAPSNFGGLGYRGFEIFFNDDSEPTHVYGGVVRSVVGSPNLLDDGREIEKSLLDTMPEGNERAGFSMRGEVREFVQEHIAKELETRIDLQRLVLWPPPPMNGNCPPNVAACAPPYEAALMWNFSPTQPYNNCYNYANDRVTNTFAQPGLYHSAQYSSLTCAGVQPAAIADGLVVASNFSQTLADGWYVALVIWPNMDFHWYRQDKIGCWSHKPGSTPAVNVDSSNNPITDPQTANRGPYTQFCSYMTTRPCKVRIR